MENKKYKIIIGVLVVLLIVAVCTIVFLISSGKDKCKTAPKPETKEEVYNIKEVLYDTTSYGNDTVEKVELTTDGTVLVSITGDDKVNMNRKEVAHGVEKTFKVNVGKSDICEGNTRIILLDGEGAATFIDIDDLVCGHNLTVKTIDGVGYITNIEDKTVKYEGEPDGHEVYAVTKDGKKVDISDKLE